MVKRFLLINIILLFSIAISYALTLDEVMQLAMQNNFEVKSLKYAQKIAKYEKLKSLDGFLPQISVEVNNGSRNTKIGSNSNFKNDIDYKVFSVKQNLFNGFSSINSLRKAENIYKQEGEIINAKLHRIFLDVVKSYISILKYKRLKEISSVNLTSQQELLNYITKKFAVKDATKAEIIKAEADYNKAKNDNISYANNLTLALTSLGRIIAVDVSKIADLEEIADISKDYDELEELFNFALEHNHDIRASNYNVKVAEYSAKNSLAALAPELNFNFQVSDQSRSIYLDNQKERDTSVFLNFKVPIFNSGQNYFDILSNKNMKNKAEYNMEAVKINIYNLIAEQLSKIKNIDLAYKSAEESKNADEVYMITLEKEEKLGTKSIIELLSAKQNLYKSQIEVVNLYYDKLYSLFELDILIGKFNNKSI